MQNRLLVDEVTKKRNISEMEEAKGKATEYKLEAAKYWNELQKLRPQMREFKEKNVPLFQMNQTCNLSQLELQNKLLEANMSLEEHKIEGKVFLLLLVIS